MTREEAIRLMLLRPAQVGRLCGFDRLRDDLHGAWLRMMLSGRGDVTLLAHRGSCKSTCLSLALAMRMLLYPRQNILFFRKTDEDAAEMIRQVRGILRGDTMRCLSAALYGHAIEAEKCTQTELTLTCYCSGRGISQLMGLGIGGSLTGKHADVIFTDDIVNLRDRVSPPERERTRAVYMELQNLRNPGGRIINTGTPWHAKDAISLMPPPMRFTCRDTGLLDAAEIDRLRRAMTPALFAANYELRLDEEDGRLFGVSPRRSAEVSLLRGGIAHVDAAYGGEDATVLTLAHRYGNTLFLLGRMWQRHVADVTDEIIRLCDRYGCSPVYCENNGDRGYLGRELRRRGMPARTYSERMQKNLKIAGYLKRAWPDIVILDGTDDAYVEQIMDWQPGAGHDDAPDSAACVCRLLDRGLRSGPAEETGKEGEKNGDHLSGSASVGGPGQRDRSGDR